MKNLKKGDVIQISRRGYYICDEPFVPSGSVENGVQSGKPAVLFYIPEGNKRESPTSYMSITNQKYKTVEVAEEAERKAAATGGKKGDAKSEAKPATTTAANFDLGKAEQLNTQIKEKGESVRNLKTQKAAKEQVDAEVKALLELKDQFKKLTLQDWKPDIVLAKPQESSNNKVSVHSL